MAYSDEYVEGEVLDYLKENYNDYRNRQNYCNDAKGAVKEKILECEAIRESWVETEKSCTSARGYN